MASEVVQLTRRGFGRTMRRDAWWVQPLIVFIVLGSFLVYATWAAFQNKYYAWGNYLSPFYSPLLFSDCSARLDPRRASLLAAGVSPIFSGAPDSSISGRVPTHLLLL